MKVLVIESGRYVTCKHATVHSEIVYSFKLCILSMWILSNESLGY